MANQIQNDGYSRSELRDVALDAALELDLIIQKKATQLKNFKKFVKLIQSHVSDNDAVPINDFTFYPIYYHALSKYSDQPMVSNAEMKSSIDDLISCGLNFDGQDKSVLDHLRDFCIDIHETLLIQQNSFFAGDRSKNGRI